MTKARASKVNRQAQSSRAERTSAGATRNRAAQAAARSCPRRGQVSGPPRPEQFSEGHSQDHGLPRAPFSVLRAVFHSLRLTRRVAFFCQILQRRVGESSQGCGSLVSTAPLGPARPWPILGAALTRTPPGAPQDMPADPRGPAGAAPGPSSVWRPATLRRPAARTVPL
jgi:hypothetical protein